MKIQVEKTITYFKQASIEIEIPAEFQRNPDTIMDFIESQKESINSELNNSADETSLGFSDETNEITFVESGLIVPSSKNPLD